MLVIGCMRLGFMLNWMCCVCLSIMVVYSIVARYRRILVSTTSLLCRMNLFVLILICWINLIGVIVFWMKVMLFVI